MKRDELLALAERVEAATGADKSLDTWIENHLDLARWERAGGYGDQDYNRLEPRAYTSSIDAALTLVPSGMPWSINYPANDGGQRSCHGIRTKPSADICGVFGCAATPALALTAAALRALAQETPE